MGDRVSSDISHTYKFPPQQSVYPVTQARSSWTNEANHLLAGILIVACSTYTSPQDEYWGIVTGL
jgi:hypothetical protein